ncbi:MAG: glycosyltransferase family 4 protein [Ktedonobacteraceae bacterium]|nr:glycosyltransferase family 4 protein [Ktedonobacteraceae bacterium]
MRILMIAPEPFLEPRGTPFSVYHRIQALIALGHEVDLVTYPFGRTVKIPGLTIHRSPAPPFVQRVKIGPSLAKFPLDLLLFFTAIKRLSRKRYYYLHTHEEASIMGTLLARIFGCKHLYDMHSDLSQQLSNFAFTRNQLLIRWAAAIQRWAIRHADVIITICADLKESVEKIAPGKPVYLIENAAVDEFLPPASEQQIAALRRRLNPGNVPVLLYTGTLESYQGIDLLLHSAVIVRKELKELPGIRYVLVGGHPEQVKEYRRLAAKLGIADIVHFTGQRPLEEMPQYTALADILLSPRSEGTNTPLKLYTYLRSGKPILATNIASHTQLLTHDIAMLVAPTAEGLAQGTLALLRNPEQARVLGMRGKAKADEHYSWPAFLEKHRQAYEQFIGQVKVVSARRNTCAV